MAARARRRSVRAGTRDLREHDPVHYSPSLDAWFVSRYDDVLRVLRSPEEFSSSAILTPAAASEARSAGATGPRPRADAWRRLHGRDARPVTLPPDRRSPRPHQAAAPRQPPVHAVGHRRARAVRAPGDRRRSSTISSRRRRAARPISSGTSAGRCRSCVIAHMLGIDADREADFREWSSAMTLGAPGEFSRAMRPGMMFEMIGYLAEAIEARRVEPRDDLISMLVTGAEPLDAQEILMFTVLLLIAGNETTTSLIGNGMLALWANPGSARAARARHLPRPVVRRRGVAVRLARAGALAADHRHGRRRRRQPSARASASTCCTRRPIGTPATSNDADELVIDREPADHIAFGNGIHFCLGAALARLEGQVAFETLLARGRSIRPAGPMVRKPTPPHPGPALLRGVARLPVAIEAR